MHKAFTVTATNLLTQPTAGAKFYFRSTSASDTGNLSVTGLVSSVSTTDGPTALTGKREILTADTFTSITGVTISAAQAGTVTIRQSGTAANGSIVVNSLPANNDTLKIGVVGFEQTYTFKSSLTGAANEIKIAASVNAQATNIYEAIDAGANAGTDYGTGTVANAYVTAAAPSGSSLVITDKIPCSRSLGWTTSQTVGTTLGLVAPIGGADGTLLATIAIGATQAYNNLSLSTEDITSGTLPALIAPTTDSVLINGKQCILRFRAATVTSSIPLKYQTSTDNTNWSDGVTAITNLSNSYTIASPQHVIPSERNIERIRLVFASNANTADAKIDARVIYPQV